MSILSVGMKRVGLSGAVLAFLAFLPAPLSAQGTGASARAACTDPHAVVKAFYDSNDARTYGASMKYIAADATIDFWATGVNGYIMSKRHAQGAAGIRKFLSQGRGLSLHLPDFPPEGPVFHETRLSVSGNTVEFMLEPDRLRPNGKPYNPYSVQAVLDGCRIKTLTVIERVTWL
jgi:hypothetical protein